MIYRLFAFLLFCSVAGAALTRNTEEAATVRSTSVSGNVQIPTSVYWPVGATPGDTVDDRAAIQTALDAAEAGGGGIVQLGAGNYKVVVVYDGATTFGGATPKLAGHYGLEVPANVWLRGAGMGATTITSHAGVDNDVTGCLISPKGMRSTTVAYACGPFVISDLKLQANAVASGATEQETGILMTAAHSDGILCERVTFGQSSHHGIDCDYNRGLTCIDCVFAGPHPGAASGSWVQLDAGLCGPASSALTTAQAPNANTRFVRCAFRQRPSTDASDRDIDLNHGSCEIRGLVFQDCSFVGRDSAGVTAIIRVEPSATAVTNDVHILNCSFTVYGATSATNDFAIYNPNGIYTTGEAQRWRIEGNLFSGAAIQFILAGMATSPVTPTAALWGKQGNWIIRANRFLIDQAASTGGTQSAMALYGLYEAHVSDNDVIQTGTNGSLSAWTFRLNNSSGTFTNNSIIQNGAPGSSNYVVVQDSSGAESAVQAGTIPGWRWLAYGNRSKGNVNTHYYFPGNAVAGGSSYAFQFFGNTTEGTGTVYTLTDQDVGNVNGQGQILSATASVNFANMAAGAEDTQTITVTGCRTTSTGASVNLGWSAALEAGIVVKQAWVSGANTVSITARNTTAGAIDPVALTCRANVTQF